ncbi:MAG: hypothetical protein KKA67_09840 [Spirochaetes bacterium]|nr:hypothetical protein [Spirochaetota bacterium]MBU1081071.1 hypothetical protein [Spirochaetota bacterium]
MRLPLALIALAALAARPPAGEAQTATREFGSTPPSSYIEAARARDQRIASRRASLQAARRSLSALDSKALAVASAGSGDALYSSASPISGSGPRVSFGPWAQVALAAPVNLVVKASVPTSLGLDGSAAAVSPSLSVTHEIGELLWKRPDLPTLRAALAASGAEIALRAARIESAALVLSSLRDWAAAENELAAARSASEAASRNLGAAISLGEYRSGSVALTRLQNAALAASLAVRKAERTLDRRRAAVESLCGFQPDERAPLPPRIAYPELSALGPGDSSSVAAAEASLELERLAYAAEWGSIPPRVSWTGSLARASASEARAEIGLESGLDASLGASVERDGLQAGASIGWNGLYGAPYVGLRISWVPGDAKAEAYREEAAAATLRASEADLRATVEAAAAELADMRLESSIADVERDRLAAAYEEARLAVLEIAELERLGLAGFAELDEAGAEMYAAAAALEASAWNAAIRAERVKADWDFPEAAP